MVEGALQTPSTLGLRLNPINPKGMDDPHWMQYPGPIQTNKQTSVSGPVEWIFDTSEWIQVFNSFKTAWKLPFSSHFAYNLA